MYFCSSRKLSALPLCEIDQHAPYRPSSHVQIATRDHKIAEKLLLSIIHKAELRLTHSASRKQFPSPLTFDRAHRSHTIFLSFSLSSSYPMSLPQSPRSLLQTSQIS